MASQPLHYTLSYEMKNYGAIVLNRVIATENIPKLGVKVGDVGGWIPSIFLPDGSPRIAKGGWVAENAMLYYNGSIGEGGLATGNSTVYEDAVVSGIVAGESQVYGKARVYENALVAGYSKIYDNAKIFGNAIVTGYAKVYGDATVLGSSIVAGKAMIGEDSVIKGESVILGNTQISGKVVVGGSSMVGGSTYLVMMGVNNRIIGNFTTKDAENLHKNIQQLVIDGILPSLDEDSISKTFEGNAPTSE